MQSVLICGRDFLEGKSVDMYAEVWGRVSQEGRWGRCLGSEVWSSKGWLRWLGEQGSWLKVV